MKKNNKMHESGLREYLIVKMEIFKAIIAQNALKER